MALCLVEIEVEGLPHAIDEFERYCLGLLDELSLSEAILGKIDSTVKILRNELNEDAYLRVLHIWQSAFDFLAENGFAGLSIEQLLIDASKNEMKETLDSDWLKRFDIVESVTAYVLLDAEKRFKDNVIETIQDSLLTRFGRESIIELFKGSWAGSLDKNLASKPHSCNFVLCENALLTDLLYSPEINSGTNEEWWIAPMNRRPLMLYIPLSIVESVIVPSDLSYREGLRKTRFDFKMRLRVEDTLEENRLPYVMNRLRMLRHMIVFNEVEFNITIQRDDDEFEGDMMDRKSRIIKHIQQQSNMTECGEYSIALVVEGEPRDPLTMALSPFSHYPGRFF